MSALPQSTYLRVLENRNRPGVRYRPDYPLVFFIFFSRFSCGVSIVSGTLQAWAYFGETVLVSTIASLGCLLAAIAISLAHLGAPKGFIGMTRNIRSRLTWEIGLSGIFLLILVLNLGLLLVNPFGSGLTAAMGWAVIVIALSALISSGLAYQFPAHPSWNTNLLPIIYLLSGLILGLSFSCVALQALDGASFLQRTRTIPLILGSLILGQLSVGYRYITYLKGFLTRTVHTLLKGTLFRIYLSLSFVLPPLIILWALVRGGLEFLPSILMAAALLCGAYLERILFFSIEKPVYFFYYAGERG